jgi:hypothetical protein
MSGGLFACGGRARTWTARYVVVMVDTLGFVAPRCEEAVELLRLLEHRQQLSSKVDELERRQRSTNETANEASVALAELECRALSGEKVSAQQRRQAEDALVRAREEVAQPWAERLAGARRAVQDADSAVRAYVAENLDVLVSELHEDAEAAAREVNGTAERFISATHERARVDRGLTALVALVRHMRPGDVTRAQSDEAVREVTRFLERGGETAPTLRAIEHVPA